MRVSELKYLTLLGFNLVTKGAFTLAVRDSSFESTTTMLVIEDLNYLS